MFNKKIFLASSAVAMMATAAITAEAQVTTSSVRGTVTNENGAAVSSAVVTIVHTPTGTVETVSTSATGAYQATGLRVGGPYTITVTADGFAPAEANNIFLAVNETFPANVTLVETRTLETVVVTASASQFEAATGPRSTFTIDTIEAVPTISRDIRDIARLDPLVSVDPTNSGAISIGGINNRFNSLTIDGIKFNDLFGLNANGFPSQRSPISVDALQTLSVEIAPYDVEFSGFTGGTVNILTKSGDNEFSGSAYYFYTDDSYAGDTINGDEITQDFEEKTWGATLGGPIIKDKLFFFAAYEEFEAEQLINEGNLPGEVSGISQATYDQVRSISQSVYGVDPLSFSGLDPVKDQKLLATLDWNITNNQRAKFTYIANEGNQINTGSNGTDLGSPSVWYDRSEESTAYAAQIFSDWTPNFSTEVKIAYSEQITGQNSLGGADIAFFEVATPEGTIGIGPDFFRHANELENELWQFKAQGTYLIGDHTVKFGWEREDQDIFNLFVPGSEGEYTFDSIADFEAGNASSLFYQNAITNNEEDGAAAWEYAVDSFFISDEWAVNDQLTLAGGLRYERYSTDVFPLENPNFEERYGFKNTASVDGLEILMPRLSFTYDYNDNVTFRGGFGKFSGGNPGVWVSNGYSNNGVIIDSVFVPGPLTGVSATDIPASAQDALTAGDGTVNLLDPNFDIPSILRANLGVDFSLDILGSEDWEFSVDYIYAQGDNAPFWKDVSCRTEAVGSAPDGRPIYNCGLDDAFIGLLSTQQIVDFYDDDGIGATAATAGFDTDGDGVVERSEVLREPQALMLTNIDAGDQEILTFKFRKEWDQGLLGADWTLGGSYTYMDVNDGHPGTSSTASSNYSDYATFDRQNAISATSNYEREHEFKLFFDFEKEFVKNFPTRLTLFGTRRAGQPFSYTFDYSGGPQRSLFGIAEGSADDEGELFYVPTGVNDPIFNAEASFGGDQATLDDFFAFLNASGLSEYAGGIAPRNAFESRWYTSFDLRLQQQLPGALSGHRTVLYVDLENIGNLLNDEWGYLEQVRYEYFQPVANVDIVDGQYVYSGFPERSEERVNEGASLWQVQLGIKYQF